MSQAFVQVAHIFHVFTLRAHLDLQLGKGGVKNMWLGYVFTTPPKHPFFQAVKAANKGVHMLQQQSKASSRHVQWPLVQGSLRGLTTIVSCDIYRIKTGSEEDLFLTTHQMPLKSD